MENKNNIENKENKMKKKKIWKIILKIIGVILLLIYICSAYIYHMSMMSGPDFKKPVIYLYPTKTINIDIEIENVDFTTTYPEYKDKWSVIANPDGTIEDKNGREYNYLYWEGKIKNLTTNIEKGFVVKKENYINFFEEKLSEIGLTDKEACDFISYWLPYCNEYEYIQVSFQTENYEKATKIKYSVNPDNELRVCVVFKGLDNPIEIEEQDLSYYKNFKREGFAVVEWGGTFLNEK